MVLLFQCKRRVMKRCNPERREETRGVGEECGTACDCPDTRRHNHHRRRRPTAANLRCPTHTTVRVCARTHTLARSLDRHPHARDKRAVRQGGRAAITHWQVLERYAGADDKPELLVEGQRIVVFLSHAEPINNESTIGGAPRSSSAICPSINTRI